MNLYDLSSEYREAMTEVHEADGELTDDMEARLDAIGGDLSAKVDAVAKLRAEALAVAAAFKAEAARLTAHRKVAENKAARLRDYLGACLRVMGTDRVKTPTHTVSFQKAPPRVALDVEVSALPAGYLRQRDPEADLPALKAALKAGDKEAETLAHLETGETLRVR